MPQASSRTLLEQSELGLWQPRWSRLVAADNATSHVDSSGPAKKIGLANLNRLNARRRVDWIRLEARLHDINGFSLQELQDGFDMWLR